MTQHASATPHAFSPPCSPVSPLCPHAYSPRAYFLGIFDQVTYRFRVLLPEHLHPSYGRGTGARFFYMVTVTVGSKHQHIPLAVLSKGFLGQQALPKWCMPHLTIYVY